MSHDTNEPDAPRPAAPAPGSLPPGPGPQPAHPAETAEHPVPGVKHEPEPDAGNLMPAEDEPGTL